ncbi:hypothetical protein BN2537_5 [Streptomyces venezuelae]|nr:hypothetical protein BN2537_5 [Streptomyces venezuelae]
MAEIERWWRRWHLIGAGVDNVWYYTREWLPCPSGGGWPAARTAPERRPCWRACVPSFSTPFTCT